MFQQIKGYYKVAKTSISKILILIIIFQWISIYNTIIFHLNDSYLEIRQEFVTEYKEGGKLIKSGKLIIVKGAPQGSILGPLP